MDKINGLPDDLLVKILSYVPTDIAVSTSILSKRWEFLWMWLPNLDYTSRWCRKPGDVGLRDFIHKNLPLHRAPVIESLRFHSNSPDIKPEDIRRWIEIAVSRHVHDLDIDHFSENENIFLSSFFACKSLVTLKLRSVTLRDIPSMDGYGDGFVFNQLEHLTLCVCRGDSPSLLGQLLKDSPNLRILEISVMEDHVDDVGISLDGWNQPSSVPECLLSSLQIFKWPQYLGRPEDRDIAVYILKNARHLKKTTILADRCERFVTQRRMIKELLQALPARIC
ncbi:F-box/RNI-like/FBD-like domains-containing protein [Arabidopsis thaliana]|uniref:F-box/RNI-like/FBD-like domains-containing protein n=1 Tax=Arabidopsis thaliana TaxID=3702 RepID=A0A1P8BCN4_ARATH|nr:F-box/RNI-like/FBD-like domains-containing protein [Arabidopsis thaliana]ANM69359.1 F-box/RNI-like/FBD-like domains-containing protein [Arabidopsis thaliana]|eukprot:NP_001331043.1 F-box/RNI-like/FBD-like domains-containing protein [Arabidopsis thaliana]